MTNIDYDNISVINTSKSSSILKARKNHTPLPAGIDTAVNNIINLFTKADDNKKVGGCRKRIGGQKTTGEDEFDGNNDNQSVNELPLKHLYKLM